MRHKKLVEAIVALSVLAPAALGGEKPAKSATPLGKDEIAIYKAVLQQYGSGEAGLLNVSVTTYPLDTTSPSSGFHNGECLRGIQLENLPTISHSFHQLPPDILPGKNMQLVDAKRHAKIVHKNDPDRTMRNGKSVESAVESAFATGLFSLSEIAFDNGHRHAAVSYRFWCGSLCGQGATLVFEKVGDEWKKTDRNCGGWIS